MFGRSLILLGFLCLACVYGQDANPYFRSDYKYIKEIDGWLKFHNAPVIWSDARDICHAEGSVLAAPLNQELKMAIVNEVPSSVLTIFIGVHSKYAKGMYASIEGVPVSKMAITWGNGEPNNLNNSESCLAMSMFREHYVQKLFLTRDVKCSLTLPYVCYKKADRSLAMNTACNTHDAGYKLDPRTGSCYKFHSYGLNWNEAYRTCMAEEGHLIIINSDVEAQVLKDVYAQHPENTIFAVFPYASIGTYLDVDGGYWLTIHGQTPVEAGYNKWQPGEPNNGTQPRGEFCGVTHRNNGFLHDAPCDWVMPFICEKNPANYDDSAETVLY